MSSAQQTNALPKRRNSTNPRPGSSAFPRAPKGADPPPLRIPPKKSITTDQASPPKAPGPPHKRREAARQSPTDERPPRKTSTTDSPGPAPSPNPQPRTQATSRSPPNNEPTVPKRSTTRVTQTQDSAPNTSTRPRPAPRSLFDNDRRPPRRSPGTTSRHEPAHNSGPSTHTRATPRYIPTNDAATKQQINQTLAIEMMTTCPVNPLPFPLPIPLGLTMLCMGAGKGGNKR